MAESNTGNSRLDTQAAIDSILIKPETEQSAPSQDEVTAEVTEVSEEPTVAEAATTTDNVAPTHDTEVAEVEAADELVQEEVTAEVPSEEEVEVSTEVEAQAEPAQEDVQEEAEVAEITYTTSDGEEVNEEELKRGYLRQSDYTQKTQTLAEERQALVTEQQGFGDQQNAAAEALMFAMNIVEPQLAQGAQTNWDALRNDDAYAYADQWAVYEQAQHRYSQLQGAAQAITQQGKAQQDVATRTYQAEQAKALHMAIPDLADKTKGKALQTSLREYAISSGLTEQEASGIKDHRIVVMMNKAMKYDEMITAGKSVVGKKTANVAKKILTPGKPVSKAERTTIAKAEIKANVKKKGTIDAGVDWLLSGT